MLFLILYCHSTNWIFRFLLLPRSTDLPDYMAPAQLDNFGQDTHGDLLRRTSVDIQARRSPHSIQFFRADASAGERLQNLGRLCPASHEGYVGSIGFECFFERLLVALSLGGDNDEGLRPNPQPVQVQICLHLIGIRISLAVGLWSGNGNRVVDGLGELASVRPTGERPMIRMRLGQNRLYINVERAATVTAHVVGHDAFLLR